MDALMLQTTAGAGEEKAKRKKTNKVVPVAEVNVAQHESLPPVKTPKKLKPLKPRTNKVAAKKTTRTHHSEDPGNPDAFANGSNAANAVPGIDQITNSSTPSWWVPPCGVDTSAGVGPDHNIMLVTDIHEGRRDAIANRKKNQPQEGMSRSETHEGAGKPYSLCTPIFSTRVPSLADMVISQTLFFPLPLLSRRSCSLIYQRAEFSEILQRRRHSVFTLTAIRLN